MPERSRPRLHQQHTKKVEGVLVAEPGSVCDGRDERHGARQDPPAQHNPGDPFAGTEAFAAARLDGTSKMKYAMKKMPAPRPNAVCDRPRSWFHRERGETHVHAVQIRDEVADDEERYDPPGDLAIVRILQRP